MTQHKNSITQFSNKMISPRSKNLVYLESNLNYSTWLKIRKYQLNVISLWSHPIEASLVQLFPVIYAKNQIIPS